MPKANVCSELTVLNIRLAVRQIVADFCANRERTVESIVNARFENLVEPIQQLVAARLGHIYEQLQYSVLSPSDEPPSFGSVLRFLSERIDESEREIVQRFGKDNISSRGHVYKERKKFTRSPLVPVDPASPVVDIPHLENLTSDRSRNRKSDKRRKSAKKMQNSNSFPFSKNVPSTSSTSSSYSLSSDDSLLQPIQERESSRHELDSSERKTSNISSCSFTERSSQYMKSSRKKDVNEEVLLETSVILEQEFVPSVPSVEEATTYPSSTNIKSKTPISLCSSLRSDDDKVTVRYIPAKVSTIDAAVSTDPAFMDNQPVEKIEVGVNTIIEMGSNTTDGSSSSNTASDNSAGQLPKRLFDTVLQRPSLRIISLRPDGSIVPKDSSVSRNIPSVREWIPVAGEDKAEKSISASDAEVCDMTSESDLSRSEHNGKERFESVSASASRPDPFEEDLNTLANISPLPHF
ncbi:Beta-ketoacyl-[acyl-carrier-protein] synthase III [Dirofilaria immitis]